jgi:DNA adenine methylase
MMLNAEPIIPWMGGKRRLADKLLPLYPPHECYVELFAGGAALFFMKPGRAKCEVLNDINGELVNLYRVVQHHLEEFVRQFKWAISSRQVFEWLKDQPTDPLTDIQRAARFYFIRHHAFGGRVSGESFGTATTGPAINLCRIEESLSAAHLRLSGVYVEHLPWGDCLEKYDRAHTFFYLDPPYWETEGYGVPFPWEEYERMARLMAAMKGKAMLSINDHPAIRECFKGFQCHELEIKYSNGNQANGAPATSRELVFTTWDADTLGQLF